MKVFLFITFLTIYFTQRNIPALFLQSKTEKNTIFFNSFFMINKTITCHLVCNKQQIPRDSISLKFAKKDLSHSF